MPPKKDYVSPEGLRLDGRRPAELRNISGALNIFPHSDGSAMIAFGNTKILATVHGPRECSGSRSNQIHDRANLNIRFHAAAFSSTGGDRHKSGKADRKLLEWSRMLEEAFERVLLLHLYPRSQIDVFVEIVGADGAVLMTAANAVTLALMNAGIAMQDYLIGVSAIYFAGQRGPNGMTTGSAIVTDPSRLEEVSGAPIIRALLLGRSSRPISLVIEKRLPSDLLPGMLSSVKKAAVRIWETLDGEIVRPFSESVLGARGLLVGRGTSIASFLLEKRNRSEDEIQEEIGLSEDFPNK